MTSFTATLTALAMAATPALSVAAPTGTTTTNGARNQPCAPFMRACQEAGFRVGERAPGHRLALDCLDRLVAGEQVMDASGKPVVVTANAGDAQACREKHAATGSQPEH